MAFGIHALLVADVVATLQSTARHVGGTRASHAAHQQSRTCADTRAVAAIHCRACNRAYGCADCRTAYAAIGLRR